MSCLSTGRRGPERTLGPSCLVKEKGGPQGILRCVSLGISPGKWMAVWVSSDVPLTWEPVWLWHSPLLPEPVNLGLGSFRASTHTASPPALVASKRFLTTLCNEIRLTA